MPIRIVRPAMLAALMVSAIGAASGPAAAQLTIEIPEDEFDFFDREFEPIPMPDPTGNPIEQMFDVFDLDMRGTLPEGVFEFELGATPYDFVDIAWGITVSGDWSQQLSGTGTLQVINFTEGMGATGQVNPETFTGAMGLRLYNAQLHTDGDYTFTLSAVLPPDPGGFTAGTPITQAKSVFEVTFVCHMFQPEDTGCVEHHDEYLKTDVPSNLHVTVGQRGDTFRIFFTARVDELRSHRDRGYRYTEPSGKLGWVDGWICNLDTWESDPDDCLEYEPLEVVERRPVDGRENVNYVTPGIEVAFNRPIEPDSIEDAFTLTTRDPQNNEIEVSGHVVQRAADRFEFFPSILESGVRYELRLDGGPGGVRARDDNGQLRRDEVWQFSTLLNLSEQPPQERLAPGAATGALPMPGSLTDPLRVHTYQTLRDAPLVQGKPTLTRVYVDWAPHDHIHPDWQPDDFEMEIGIDRHHPRTRGQYDTAPFPSDVVRIYRQDEFSAEDRRMALHTINAFGWRPTQSDGGRIEVSVQPYDPFPDPLEDAEEVEGRDVEVWNHDPGTLRFNYAVAELGPWADGMPDAEAQLMRTLVPLAEDYAVQFLPYRNAQGRYSGLSLNNLDIYVNFAREPELVAMGYVGESLAFFSGSQSETGVGPALRSLPTGVFGEIFDYATDTYSDEMAEAMERLRPRMRLGPALRFFQRVLRETSGRDDYLVVFAPPGIFGERTVGSAVSQSKDFIFTGFGGFDNGVVVLTLDADGHLGADQYATALLHEFGHVMNLPHNQARTPAIEGFRLTPSGLSGWNKSREEGNAEHESGLVSLMWPEILTSNAVMPTMDEYLWMQNAIERGWRASAPPSSPITRFAQLAPQTQTDAGPPAPKDAVVVTGRMDPNSDMIMLETLMPGEELRGEGPLTAELRGADEAVLAATRFDISEPETGRTHALQQLVEGPIDPDDPSWWPHFRFSLTPDTRATHLVIRHHDSILAWLDAPGGPPRLDLGEAVRDNSGTVTADWRAEGAAPLRYDVAYSPDGMAPWRLLSYRQSDSRLEIDFSALQDGPDPTIRVIAHDGFHFTTATRAIDRSNGLTPPAIRLPDGPKLIAGQPIELLFDTEIPVSHLTEFLRITDATGAEIETDLFHHADRDRVSILATTPIEPGGDYALRLEAGLTDRWGGVLQNASVWTLVGADE